VIVEGVLEEAGDRSIDELAAARDAMLLELEATRAKHEQPGRPIAAADPRNP
jgi:hypothetical protein